MRVRVGGVSVERGDLLEQRLGLRGDEEECLTLTLTLTLTLSLGLSLSLSLSLTLTLTLTLTFSSKVSGCEVTRRNAPRKKKRQTGTW